MSLLKLLGSGIVVFAASSAALAGGGLTLTPPQAYQSLADSPFFGNPCLRPGIDFYFEDFEDGLVNSPGFTLPATNPPIWTVKAPSPTTDSVDVGGSSLTNAGVIVSLSLTFNNGGTIGGFPEQVGFVWTDSGGVANVTLTIFVQDGAGATLNQQIFNLGDALDDGGTAEDRFIGVSSPSGIAQIQISQTVGSLEIDHVQYTRPTPAPPHPRCDFNGDGRGDLFFKSLPAGDTSAVILNGTNVVANDTILSGIGPDWTALGVADFDGDCDGDILWRNALTGSVYMWRMQGSMIAAAEAVFPSPLPGTWQVAAIGDFDGDGRADIFWKNDSLATTAMWLMNGSTITNSTVVFSPISSEWKVESAADFDHDGKADLLWRNTVTGDVAYWKMNGSAIAGAGTISAAVPLDWDIELSGDFNADGTPDILWRNTLSGGLGIWFMNGFAFSSGSTIFPVFPFEWQIVGATDTDLNGTADIVLQNTNTNELVVWPMNGASIVNGAFLMVPSTAGTVITDH